MIVGLGGMIKSGKDTVADFLIKNHGFVKLSFAGNLKKMCMRVFNLSAHQCYSQEGKEKKFDYPVHFDYLHCERIADWLRDENDWPLNKDQLLKISELVAEENTFNSSREILQWIGTELCRNCIDDNYHIKVAMEGLESSHLHYVFSDSRFPNERDAVKNAGGFNILVKDPTMKEIGCPGLHASETSLGIDTDYDLVINNDKKDGLAHLEGTVNSIYDQLNWLASKQKD